MAVRERYVALLMNQPAEFGLSEVKFVHMPQISVGRAVRLRCQYACSHTRQSDLVPPHSPSSGETREILDEYRYGLFMRREEPFGERHPDNLWREYTEQILRIERDATTQGYRRAFALAIGTCLHMHEDDTLRPCEFNGKARPTFESVGIDLKETLEMIQWHGLLAREPDDPFQLFSILLLE